MDQEGAVDNNEMMLSFTIAAFTSITTLLDGESFHIGGGSPDIKTKGTHTFPECAPISGVFLTRPPIGASPHLDLFEPVDINVG